MPRPAQALIKRVCGDLAAGSIELAELSAGGASERQLDLRTPEGLQRYARILGPRIESALAETRREKLLIIALLIGLFLVAIVLTIVAHFKASTPLASAAPIAGLGVTAAWPIRALTNSRRDELRLRLLPQLLPLLSQGEADQVLRAFLLG